MNYKIRQIGDQAISIYFENRIDVEVNKRVHFLSNALLQAHIKGVRGIVPAYQSLLIYFDHQKINMRVLKSFIEETLVLVPEHFESAKIGYRIPVLYDGADLAHVAQYHNMPINEVVERHTAPYYYIYFLGFAPGFPYLGGLDSKIATPRHAKPKLKIASGSVGIADQQTGIYTIDSPGGWQVIGRTPLKLYIPDKNILEAGKYIKFYSVDLKTYNKELLHQDQTLKLEVLE